MSFPCCDGREARLNFGYTELCRTRDRWCGLDVEYVPCWEQLELEKVCIFCKEESVYFLL